MTEVAAAVAAPEPPAPTAAVEVTKTTLEVLVRNETFEFKIPSLHDEIGVGSRITLLRRNIDPLWDGYSMGLDGNTQYQLRACATFEMLLKRASALWPFSAGPNGPVVDFSKFPIDKVDMVEEVYRGYLEALGRFRTGGA